MMNDNTQEVLINEVDKLNESDLAKLLVLLKGMEQ